VGNFTKFTTSVLLGTDILIAFEGQK